MLSFPIQDRDDNPTGLGGRDPQILGRGGHGGCGRFVKYYYISSCTESMFESSDFWREIE